MLFLIRRLRQIGVALLASTLLFANGQTPPADAKEPALPASSASAQNLFSKNKESLLQIRILLASANEQSALGSGFVVSGSADRKALVVTNYHVISALAMDPDKYRIELRATDNRSFQAKLLAIDVIHDLAILDVAPSDATTQWKRLPLREEPLAQGSKVFSSGNPLELGFLISEGIYNGLVESRLYDQMLFSGAINSGMSGGPAIDEQSRVVGINVATRRDGESLSFLVPVQYARTLLNQAAKGVPRSEWRTEIARQLHVHQDFLASQFRVDTSSLTKASSPSQRGAFRTQKIAGRTVPTLDGSFTKCWAHGAEGEKLRFQRDSLNCGLHEDLFVNNALYTGSIALRHTLVRNEQLATAQFLKMNDSPGRFFSYSGRTETTRKECKGNYLQSTQHIYQVSICLRAYKRFKDLYDLTLHAVQVDDVHERMSSSMELSGFSFDNAQYLSKQFLERMQ